MKLFSSPTSPYARKVRILIEELGLIPAVKVTPSVPMENPQDLQTSNPLGKVPALVLENGTALYDSIVICEYFDAQNGNKFLPVIGDERWDCLRRHALGDGVMDASFLRTMERLKPQNEQSSLWLERWTNAMLRGVDAISTDRKNAGDRFDLGDITAACALGYLDLRHGDLEWRKGRNDLAAWFETVSQRRSLQMTVPA